MLLSLVTKTLRSLQMEKNGLSEWKMFAVFPYDCITELLDLVLF